MPVLKIYYEDGLDDVVRTRRSAIQAGLETMMRDVLAADPANCQVVMVAVRHCSPKPVYVDMQFRATAHRTQAVVAQAMNDMASVIGGLLNCGMRIRAFDIDQSRLHALDTDGAA